LPPSWTRWPSSSPSAGDAPAPPKYEDTPYALEPNCKESPGGLRDLQVIGWAMRAAGIGQRWDELARAGLATALEVRQLRATRPCWRACAAPAPGGRPARGPAGVRPADRRGRVLRLPRTAPDGRLALRASELLMRRYYWAAKAVTQLNQILLQNIEERLRAERASPRRARPLNARFLERAGLLEVAATRCTAPAARHPGDLSAARARAGRQGPVGAHAARALQRARRDGPRFRATRSTASSSWRSCSSRRASPTPSG
jgi:[protein-PII] uridylyltransferase